MSKKIKKLITTCLYLGYIPIIPGTFGSLVGFFIYLFLRDNFYLLILVHAMIMLLGFFFSGEVAKLFNLRDPSQIIIDEINGMLISFIGISADKFTLFSGFIIFRILDALKPFPANRLQRIPGSLGIMGDDIVAGIYTNLLLRFLISFY